MKSKSVTEITRHFFLEIIKTPQFHNCLLDFFYKMVELLLGSNTKRRRDHVTVKEIIKRK